MLTPELLAGDGIARELRSVGDSCFAYCNWGWNKLPRENKQGPIGSVFLLLDYN